MKFIETGIDGLIVFEPTPARDERGYFTRTFDVQIAADAGIDPAMFKQENQSRSYQGVVRGLHGRMNRGEAAGSAARTGPFSTWPSTPGSGPHLR